MKHFIYSHLERVLFILACFRCWETSGDKAGSHRTLIYLLTGLQIYKYFITEINKNLLHDKQATTVYMFLPGTSKNDERDRNCVFNVASWRQKIPYSSSSGGIPSSSSVHWEASGQGKWPYKRIRAFQTQIQESGTLVHPRMRSFQSQIKGKLLKWWHPCPVMIMMKIRIIFHDQVFSILIHFLTAASTYNRYCPSVEIMSNTVNDTTAYKNCIGIVPKVPEDPEPHGPADQFRLKLLLLR